MTPSLVFNANDIPLEGIAVDAELPVAWLDVALGGTEVSASRRHDGGGRVVGRLSRSGNDIVVRTRVRARVALPCARCLEVAPVDVDTDLSLLLQPAARNDPRVARLSNRGTKRRPPAADGEHEFSAAEAEVDVYDGEAVVLDDFVREAILLEVPSFPLCRESCRGIAPRVGEQPAEPAEPVVEVDPRLAPLGAFRQRPPDAPVTVEDLMAAAQARGKAGSRKPRLRTNQAAPRRRRRS
jgi:DUF177 domain-containing protein